MRTAWRTLPKSWWLVGDPSRTRSWMAVAHQPTLGPRVTAPMTVPATTFVSRPPRFRTSIDTGGRHDPYGTAPRDASFLLSYDLSRILVAPDGRIRSIARR